MHKGLYKATVIFFSFCNAPATFQEMMNTIFADLIKEGKMAVYLDDILIFNNNL